MIILNKRKSRLDYAIKFLKRIHKVVYLLVILIVIAIPLYYRMLTMPEPTFEDQMKDYSKEVTAPELQIDIKFENYQKLLYQRRQALRSRGNGPFNYDEKFNDIPAKITYLGKSYKADLKLKGLRKDHYSDSTRMSFNIKLKDENIIMGMNRFSLHDPKMRNYIYEWLFHKLLGKEGFIALKYDFVNVTINGERSGIYAIEESIDKALLERYGYLDGPVFKLMDDADSLLVVSTEVFNEKKYNSEEWENITEKALQMGKEFYSGKYKLGSIANSEMFAKYFAICDVFMFFHGTLIKSIRVYYNPVTCKFEPIGFDGHAMTRAPNFISSEVVQRINEVHQYFFAVTMFQEFIFLNQENYDEEFLKLYAQYLNKYSSVEFIDSFFEEITEELKFNLGLIYKNYPLLEDYVNHFGPETFNFSRLHINKQAKYIRDMLNFKGIFSDLKVSSRIEKSSLDLDTFNLEVSNNYPLSLIINKIVINDSLELFPVSGDFALPNKYSHLRNYKNVKFKNVKNIPEEVISAKLYFSIAGLPAEHFVQTELYDNSIRESINDIIRDESSSKELNEYFIRDEKNILKFKKGKHTVKKHIKIPKGYKVLIQSGTEINFKDSAFMLSYSRLVIEGDHDDPVKITSDKTGGIAVFDCESMSVIKNTVFENLSFPHNNEWKLTSAITFYKSPVLIENTEFKDNSSEDYLNVKLTEFKILNSKFTNVFSDAFDSDFSKGELTNCYFNASGNDAVDVSGSVVTCSGLEIRGAGDKAFSSGEGSFLTVNEAKIADSEICFASKDNSTIEASGITINNCKLGFTAYQKKPEYGSGSIIAEKVKYEKLIKETLVEIGSSVILNGKNIEGDIEDVKDDYLYGKEFGSPSKR